MIGGCCRHSGPEQGSATVTVVVEQQYKDGGNPPGVGQSSTSECQLTPEGLSSAASTTLHWGFDAVAAIFVASKRESWHRDLPSVRQMHHRC